MDDAKSFTERCQDFLDKEWRSISKKIQSSAFSDPLSPEDLAIKKFITECQDSNIKSYHYVLPTQLLAKCVNPKLDCRSIQTAYKKPGAFDARTIAHQVIVPFDQANHRVLGGSTEPYVNNPLRCPAVTKKYRSQQKNKQDWDRLVTVLDEVEKRSDISFTSVVFDQVLVEIYHLLADVQVVYPTPNRVSLAQTIDLVSEYVYDKSGGDRMEAVCTALFRAITKEFRIFDDVRRQKVNTADASSGMGADIECRLKGKIVLLVEVKDRSLTLTQIDSKLDVARARKMSEILFLAEQGLDKADKENAEARILSEFTSGQNVYVSNFLEFSSGILILLGEKGRVLFLSFIGEELDRATSSIVHRKAWANLLKTI